MLTVLHAVTETTPFGEVTRDMPRAYLGLAKAFLPQRVARICMSCDDRAEAEAIAIAEECEMTHALCQSCFDQQMKNLSHENQNI